MDVVALVPAAVGIALSPLVVASIVFLLGHRGGYASAAACATGWVLSVAAALVVAVVLGERLPAPSDDATDVRAVIEVVAGVLLLALAVWGWVARRLPDGRPRSAGWSDLMAAIGPARAVVVGVAWFVTNPKAVVLSLTAGLVVGDADPSLGSVVVTGTAYVVVAGSTAVLLGLSPKIGAVISTVPAGVLGGATTALYGLIGVIGIRIWVENRVDFAKPKNQLTAGVALIMGIADFTFSLGGATFGGIIIGTIAAIVVYHLMDLVGRARGTDPATPTASDDERAAAGAVPVEPRVDTAQHD